MHLSGVNKTRVDLATCLYRLTGEIAAYCIQHHIMVSIENPARSHFWVTSFFRKPLKGLFHKLQSTYFHHCMHGSRRKHTLLMHNCPALDTFSVMCDGNHVHEPWGLQKTWATSQETAYPALLCQRYAEAFAQHLHECGYVGLPHELTFQAPLVDNPKLNQIAAGKQPRGKEYLPWCQSFQLLSSFLDLPRVCPFDPSLISHGKSLNMFLVVIHR